MTASRAALTVTFTLLAAAGCGGGGAADNPLAGPCVVQYAEPIVSIAQAVDAVSSAPLPTVTLSELSFNGKALDPGQLPVAALNLAAAGSQWICTTPCAFGSEAGEYRFSAAAEGHAAQPVNVTATYAQFTGGCPATYSGATRVTLRLSAT